MENATIILHVNLLEEGSPVYKKVKAQNLGDDLYKLLADADYDPEDEVWEFLPGTIVKAEKKVNFGQEILVAIKAL